MGTGRAVVRYAPVKVPTGPGESALQHVCGKQHVDLEFFCIGGQVKSGPAPDDPLKRPDLSKNTQPDTHPDGLCARTFLLQNLLSITNHHGIN